MPHTVRHLIVPGDPEGPESDAGRPTGTHVTGRARRPPAAPPFLGYALVRVAHLLSQRMDRDLADLDLSSNGFGVLFQLDGDPDVSAAELARRVVLTPQSVGPLLDRMARDGLVERERPGGPGTAIVTRITVKGRQRLAEATALVRSLDDGLVVGLGTRQRDALDRQLWEMLRALAPDAGPQGTPGT